MGKKKAAEIALKGVSAIKNKRKNNFWDLAFLFNDFGIGVRFIRKIWWNKPETFWQISRVIPTNSVRF